MPKRSLSQPFLTTVAVVAAAATAAFTTACSHDIVFSDGSASTASTSSGSGGGSISSSTSGSTSGATSSTSSGPDICPANPPTDGAACSGGAQCTYGDPCEVEFSTFAICEDGAWDVSEGYISCNPPPPPPECPQSMPGHGDGCEIPIFGEEYTCGYDDTCGETQATCSVNSGTWQLVPTPCNPPPPDYCYAIDNESICANQAACTWFVPGCGDTPLGKAGCHPNIGCDQLDLCNDAQFCAELSIDPCHDDGCLACDEPVWVCAPT